MPQSIARLLSYLGVLQPRALQAQDRGPVVVVEQQPVELVCSGETTSTTWEWTLTGECVDEPVTVCNGDYEYMNEYEPCTTYTTNVFVPGRDPYVTVTTTVTGTNASQTTPVTKTRILDPEETDDCTVIVEVIEPPCTEPAPDPCPITSAVPGKEAKSTTRAKTTSPDSDDCDEVDVDCPEEYSESPSAFPPTPSKTPCPRPSPVPVTSTETGTGTGTSTVTRTLTPTAVDEPLTIVVEIIEPPPKTSRAGTVTTTIPYTGTLTGTRIETFTRTATPTNPNDPTTVIVEVTELPPKTTSRLDPGTVTTTIPYTGTLTGTEAEPMTRTVTPTDPDKPVTVVVEIIEPPPRTTVFVTTTSLGMGTITGTTTMTRTVTPTKVGEPATVIVEIIEPPPRTTVFITTTSVGTGTATGTVTMTRTVTPTKVGEPATVVVEIIEPPPQTTTTTPEAVTIITTSVGTGTITGTVTMTRTITPTKVGEPATVIVEIIEPPPQTTTTTPEAVTITTTSVGTGTITGTVTMTRTVTPTKVGEPATVIVEIIEPPPQTTTTTPEAVTITTTSVGTGTITGTVTMTRTITPTKVGEPATVIVEIIEPPPQTTTTTPLDPVTITTTSIGTGTATGTITTTRTIPPTKVGEPTTLIVEIIEPPPETTTTTTTITSPSPSVDPVCAEFPNSKPVPSGLTFAHPCDTSYNKDDFPCSNDTEPCIGEVAKNWAAGYLYWNSKFKQPEAPEPYNTTTKFEFPTVMTVTDFQAQSEHFLLKLDGNFLGETGGETNYSNLYGTWNLYPEWCLRNGYTRGWFLIPAGQHNISIEWPKGTGSYLTNAKTAWGFGTAYIKYNKLCDPDNCPKSS